MSGPEAAPGDDEVRAAQRALRREASTRHGSAAATALADRADGWSVLAGIGVVAAYSPVDGELDPGPLLRRLADAGAAVLLPVVVGDRLVFGPAGPGVELRRNRFGISEPHGVDPVEIDGIDVVLVPLVAVDVAGNRRGFGAGFYDRTFAPLLVRPRPSRPVLVGLAYDEQVMDRVAAREWDVPLDAVLTPTRRIGVSVPSG